MNDNEAKIYLAGGCFWGVEGYLSQLKGVICAQSGYANGNVPNPSYELVCTNTTGFVECVEVLYNSKQISLAHLLFEYFQIIDPTSLNKQGVDEGMQYRTGIYYQNTEDKTTINEVIKVIQKHYDKPVVVEVKPLENFYLGEDYHQKYLEKHPNYQCHLPHHRKSSLTPKQFEVTQNNATEQPFSGQYNDFNEVGLYVDIVSGEALFTSMDKFNSGCGWPSFSHPIKDDSIVENNDESHGMSRIEVRSNFASSHLGHVFNDGPKELGGLRYCINSAALRFIPVSQLEEENYGEYCYLFK